MKNKLMLGLWRYIINLPPFLWEKQVVKAKNKFKKELGSIAGEYRLVHHFVVRELPYVGKQLSSESISSKLNLPMDRVKMILDYLEKRLILYRNIEGKVVWAYPVTVDKTPHHVTFHTGEQLYAAWAADAFATPFVQGQLRNEYVKVLVNTKCAHCSRTMELEIDSDLNCTVKEKGCEPIVFVPDVDIFKIEDESIINAFWKQSVFFWSEEHAKEHRKKIHRIRGVYLTAPQMIEGTKLIQSVIFGFKQRKTKRGRSDKFGTAS